MTEREQIECDIDAWSEKKLQQWMLDSIERYKIVDMSESAALARTTVILIALLGKVLAAGKATPEEVGYKMMETIKFLRQRRSSDG